MIILLIILVPAVPFFCLLKKRKWKFWLDESSLHVQPLFWFLVFLPLIISGIAWVLVAQDYELDVSTNGYSRLMENAKFPFLILALSPILGAFVTSAHRSLQTEIQIKTANDQLIEARNKNKVDIYFAKRKFINEQLSSVTTINNEKINRLSSLYFSIFSIKGDLNDDLNPKFISCLKLYLIDINDELNSITKLKDYNDKVIFLRESNDETNFIQSIIKIDKALSDIKKFLCIENNSDGVLLNLKNELKLKNDEYYREYNKTCLGLIPIPEQIEDEVAPSDYAEMCYDNNTEQAFYSFMRQFGLILYDILTVIDEVFLIALPNKNANTELPILLECEQKLTDILDANPYYVDKIIGDKLAAENPNPPE